jgi:hypothetical protein
MQDDLVDPDAAVTRPKSTTVQANTGTELAWYIIRHPLVTGCSIDNRNGGFRTPVGPMAGLHRIMDNSFPTDRRGVWLTRSTVRAPAYLLGTATHAAVAAWVNDKKSPKDKRAGSILKYLERVGLIPIRAEVRIFATGFAATALDLICCRRGDNRVVVIEIKTTTKDEAHHLATYRAVPGVVPTTHTQMRNSEFNKHQLQLAAGLYMVSTTLGIPSNRLDGLVLVCTLDRRIHAYPIAAPLLHNLGQVLTLLRPRPAETKPKRRKRAT